MSTQPKTYITPEQYLEIERKAEFKSEYYAGEMFAMAGAREAHNLVTGNAFGITREQLRFKPYRVYSSQMRVRVSPTGLYTYPDVVAVCDQPLFLDRERDTLLNPAVIIEVLSPSTEAYDRGMKFEHYKTIKSLTEYLLIATDDIHVDLYRRKPEGWLLTSATEPEEIVELQSVGARIRVADLYEKVELPPGLPGPRQHGRP